MREIWYTMGDIMQPIVHDEKCGVFYRAWKAARPEAVVLLVHGLGAHTARWEFLARYCLKNNVSSYALELKGFGETPGMKGHIDSFKTYFDDVLRLYDISREENPAVKTFLLGESMGAIISFLMAAAEPDIFSGLICISPAFVSRMKLSVLDYLKIFLPLFYNPKKQHDMPFDASMCTRDVEFQKQMDFDEREHRLATSKLLFEILKAQIRALVIKNKIKTPLLVLLAGEDKLADPAASKKVFDSIKMKDKKIIQYPEMYHALSIDAGREKVFEDILDWMKGLGCHPGRIK